MRTEKARETFEKGLKEISKIRFSEPGMHGKRVVKPVSVEICYKSDCNAGNDCCHRIRRQNISFCVS
jgi:hypothetical protein